MAKKKTKKVVANDAIENSTGIGGGMNIGGFPGNQGPPFAQTVSTVNPTFENLRWYLISNDRQFLCELYVEIGLMQTIVDVPVEDALRGGVEIKSDELTEDELKELTSSLDRDNDLNTVGQAAKWNRLFGGAGILILTDQDPEEPLDLDAIGSDTPLEFRAVDMWELFWDKQGTDGYNPETQSEDVIYYSYYGVRVHKSRVMKMIGLTAPSFIRPRLRGWGFSVIEALIRSINQYLRATSVCFEVLDEFKLDIYKIKNLVNTLLSPNGSQQVQARVAQNNYTKNFQNAIVMDGEDEYIQKQLSFTGFADAMAQIRMQVASDMRMPLTKLFGISASGFSSGDEDIENYHSMVESTVRNKIKYDILRLIEIKCQKLFGFIPNDLTVGFKPLKVLSAEQEETVKEKKFNRLYQTLMAGFLTEQEFRDACNKGNLFDISLDDKEIIQGGYMDDNIEQGPGQPTANRPITQKPQAQQNSDQFDRASYDADGGDAWMDDRRKHFYEDPSDRGHWDRVQEETRRVYGEDNWKFSVWLYSKQGGRFDNDGDEITLPTMVTGDL